MPTIFEELQHHWDNCTLPSCEFSSEHYDSGSISSVDDLLENISGKHLPASFGKTSSQGAESYAAKMDKNSARNVSAFQLAVLCYHDVLKAHAALRKKYNMRHAKGHRFCEKVESYMQRRREKIASLMIQSAEEYGW